MSEKQIKERIDLIKTTVENIILTDDMVKDLKNEIKALEKSLKEKPNDK